MIDWISLSQTAGTGNATITVSASSYAEAVDRAAFLKVRTVSNAVQRYVTIQQTAQPPFTVSPSNISVAGSGGTYSISINSTREWSATTVPSWITLSTVSGVSGQTITANIGENYGNSKTGTIYFENAKGQTATVQLTQSTQELPLPTSPYEIWYTTSDEQIVEVPSSNWGTVLSSNTYENGHGVLRFSGRPRYIAEDAFKNSSTLLSVTVPASLSEIGQNAFYGCSNMRSFKSPSDGNLWSVKLQAFCYCSSLSDIQFPDLGPSYIEGCAFQETAISSFVFKESCWFIGYKAFKDCENLTSVTFYHDYSAAQPIYHTPCSDHYYYCSSDVFDNVASTGTVHTPSGVTGTTVGNWTNVHDIGYRTFSSYVIFPYDFADDNGWWYNRVFCFGPTDETISVSSGYNATFGDEIDNGNVKQYVVCADYTHSSAVTVNVTLDYGDYECEYTRFAEPVVTGTTSNTNAYGGNVTVNGRRLSNIVEGSFTKSPSNSKYYVRTVYGTTFYIDYNAQSSATVATTFTFNIKCNNGWTISYSYEFDPYA